VKKLKLTSRVSFQSCRRNRIEPPSQPSAPSPRSFDSPTLPLEPSHPTRGNAASSSASSRRSRCGCVRGCPVLSSHFLPGPAPQVGQRTACTCLRVGFLAFMVADCAAIRTKKNGQFRTVNSDNWRKTPFHSLTPARPILTECKRLISTVESLRSTCWLLISLCRRSQPQA